MAKKRKEEVKSTIPKIALLMKPVDGGGAIIGTFDCPNCGEQHFTTLVKTGERDVFCGTNRHGKDGAVRPDGYSTVDVQVII